MKLTFLSFLLQSGVLVMCETIFAISPSLTNFIWIAAEVAIVWKTAEWMAEEAAE